MEANPFDPEWFLKKAGLAIAITPLPPPGGFQVRLQRRKDRSTISFIIRKEEPPSIEDAVGELKWLFSVTDHQARTWNRLAEFFTEDEVALLKEKPQAGLDALVESQ